MKRHGCALFVVALAATACSAKTSAVRESHAPGETSGEVDGIVSGDVSGITDYQPGRIEVMVKEGFSITDVVTAHGGTPAQIHQAALGPFNPIDEWLGIDREYVVDVALGSEIAKVGAYAADSRVEYAGLVGGIQGTFLRESAPEEKKKAVPHDSRGTNAFSYRSNY